MKTAKYWLSAGLIAASLSPAIAKDLNKMGILVGSMGNPYFVALIKGAEAQARQANPNVEVTALGSDYDINKQFTQIDNFIAAGMDLILLDPVDAKALAPAIKRAQAAGIPVVAVDSAADGADATVTTNNTQAGEIACQYIVDKLKGVGKVIIQNGPQVSAVTDRVKGCKAVLATAKGIEILSSDQDGKGSRDGGFAVTQGYLTRFDKIDAIFTINDPQAIGTQLAIKQLKRTGIIISSVDGAPDVEAALKDPNSADIQASASQDPYVMARLATKIGIDLLAGKKPQQATTLIPSKLIDRNNVNTYIGWAAER